MQRPSSRGLALVKLLLFAFLVNKALHLRYPDLVYTYPFLSFDGLQWISQGLVYAGFPVEDFLRNPGLPLVIAALARANELALLPVLHVGLLAVFLGATASLLSETFTPRVVAWTILTIGFGYTVGTFFDMVLADPWAVTAELLCLIELSRAARDPRRLIHAGLWAGVSALFQYAIVCLGPAIAFDYFWRIRRESTVPRAEVDRTAALGALVAAIPILGVWTWNAWGRHPLVTFHVNHVIAAPVLRVGQILAQLELLRPHLGGVTFYAIGFVNFVGLPAAALALAGLWRARALRGPSSLFASIAVWAALFWTFFYRWLDVRFILYGLPGIVWLVALGWKWLDERWEEKGKGWVAAGTALASLAVVYAAQEHLNPFDNSRVMAAPFLEIRWRMLPHPEGDVDIDLPSARPARAGLDAFDYLLRSYARWSGQKDPGVTAELARMNRLRRALETEGIKGPVSWCVDDHALSQVERWQREITLRVAIWPCDDSRATTEIVRAEGADYGVVTRRTATSPSR